MHGVPLEVSWFNRGAKTEECVVNLLCCDVESNTGGSIYKHHLVYKHNGRVVSLKAQNKC